MLIQLLPKFPLSNIMSVSYFMERQLISGILKSLRPKQWTKNGFIFAALIFDIKLFQTEPFIKTVYGFILLCLISGTVYIINDLVVIDRDRHHPTK
jgi:4-hydroxybenzoate polyprenyltransferase